MKKLTLVLVIVLAFFLAGCSVVGSAHVDSTAKVAKSTPTAAPTPKVNPLLKGFGQVITYTDGVSVSIAKPVPYHATEEAAGVISGHHSVLITIIVTNHSKSMLDLSAAMSPEMTSGGQTASEITDIGTRLDVGDDPETELLPGQTIKWNDAYSAVNPADVTVQYAPGYDYDAAIFDSSH